MKNVLKVDIALLLLITSIEALAHGESVRGTGGGTLNTVGAETQEGNSLSVRYDRRTFELFSDEQLLDFRRNQGEDVHQHAREETVFLAAVFGLTKDAELSLQLPFTRFSGFKDNSDDFAIANDTISTTDRSDGIGDLLIMGKYRFWEQADHHLAALFGLKLPTGNIRQRTNNGDIVGTHNQPGSGSIDFQLGGAYTGHFFAEEIGVSADVIARINSEGANDFRSGNSVQMDVAVSFRPHRPLVPILELNFITQQRDIENNEIKRNSGVSSLFWSIGARIAIDNHHGDHSLFGYYSQPVWQDLPGIQNEEDYRLGFGYGLGF